MDLNNTVNEEDFEEEILNGTQDDMNDESSQIVDNILPSQVKIFSCRLNRIQNVDWVTPSVFNCPLETIRNTCVITASCFSNYDICYCITANCQIL